MKTRSGWTSHCNIVAQLVGMKLCPRNFNRVIKSGYTSDRNNRCVCPLGYSGGEMPRWAEEIQYILRGRGSPCLNGVFSQAFRVSLMECSRLCARCVRVQFFAKASLCNSAAFLSPAILFGRIFGANRKTGLNRFVFDKMATHPARGDRDFRNSRNLSGEGMCPD